MHQKLAKQASSTAAYGRQSKKRAQQFANAEDDQCLRPSARICSGPATHKPCWPVCCSDAGCNTQRPRPWCTRLDCCCCCCRSAATTTTSLHVRAHNICRIDDSGSDKSGNHAGRQHQRGSTAPACSATDAAAHLRMCVVGVGGWGTMRRTGTSLLDTGGVSKLLDKTSQTGV